MGTAFLIFDRLHLRARTSAVLCFDIAPPVTGAWCPLAIGLVADRPGEGLFPSAPNISRQSTTVHREGAP